MMTAVRAPRTTTVAMLVPTMTGRRDEAIKDKHLG
jgi:hypothetical protein